MKDAKEELIQAIESARQKLNISIDNQDDYQNIYQYSIELDGLIEQYIVAGY